ncbi:uncharacterized protein LY89DRAFT_674034 [Mollisia scopiformis]|uniref:F-box domain-containing protein n=1 Tax=Mollisia scopiformis TaxID=149040 RepID=A0A194WU03_MOLSC|nr:uncharacterized protein LY89DRAFT_674034 [Mollisia scopiformis]KUJ11438.1 hypothetical protein LY89DRAFT_674034 [Mollisia scopiformis]
MTSLEDLADEIVLEILEHLELDNLTLSSICRTSSRLNSLARPILYKSIFLILPPHEPIIQLTQSLDSDKDLAPLIHRLHLTWPSGGHVPAYDKVKIQELLHKLTSLRHLCVRVPHDQRSTLSVLEFAEYKELQYVNFDYPDLTNATIMKFMFLPKIKQMDIMFFKSLSDPTIPLDCQPGTSPVETLRFGTCTPREVVLRTFLQCPAALETLSFTVPPFAEQFQTSTSTRDFSPRKIGDALAPVRHSLVNLTVGSRSIHRHDGSRLDISAFEKLTHISVPSILFFKSSRPRDGVYRLLPRSLETLEICFSEPPWIFQSDTVIEEDEEAAAAAKEKWILELALNKAVYLPLLSRVKLRELRRVNVYPFTGYKSPIPENIQEAFDEKDIHIEIWTRKLR